jgi:hypothetical protein
MWKVFAASYDSQEAEVSSLKKYPRLTFDVQCNFCGTPFRARRDSLLAGMTASCGCRIYPAIILANLKHGHARRGKITPEFRAWTDMWQRVANPKNRRYKDYGGRGLIIHPEWGKFENFLRDMGSRPNRDYSLDRINNNEGYEMLNCRWATRKQQQNNKRAYATKI